MERTRGRECGEGGVRGCWRRARGIPGVKEEGCRAGGGRTRGRESEDSGEEKEELKGKAGWIQRRRRRKESWWKEGAGIREMDKG